MSARRQAVSATISSGSPHEYIHAPTKGNITTPSPALITRSRPPGLVCITSYYQQSGPTKPSPWKRKVKDFAFLLSTPSPVGGPRRIPFYGGLAWALIARQNSMLQRRKQKVSWVSFYPVFVGRFHVKQNPFRYKRLSYSQHNPKKNAANWFPIGEKGMRN